MRTPTIKGSKKVRATIRICSDASRELAREARKLRFTRNLLITEILRERYSLPSVIPAKASPE